METKPRNRTVSIAADSLPRFIKFFTKNKIKFRIRELKPNHNQAFRHIVTADTNEFRKLFTKWHNVVVNDRYVKPVEGELWEVDTYVSDSSLSQCPTIRLNKETVAKVIGGRNWEHSMELANRLVEAISERGTIMTLLKSIQKTVKSGKPLSIFQKLTIEQILNTKAELSIKS